MAIKKIMELLDSGAYRALLLDLDNTVYPYEPAHQAALDFCRMEFSRLFPEKADIFDEQYRMARHVVHERLKGQAAMHSRLLYFQHMFESILGTTDPALTLDFERHYWDRFMDHMRADEEVMGLLDYCSLHSLPVCIVTDLTAQIQHRKLNRLGIQDKVKYMVSSEESGMEKPAAVIFELALKKLGLAASEVVMVGDSVSKDIEGAEKAGIRGVHYVAGNR